MQHQGVNNAMYMVLLCSSLRFTHANGLPNAADHTVAYFLCLLRTVNAIDILPDRRIDRDVLEYDLNSLHQWSSTWELNFNTNVSLSDFPKRKPPTYLKNIS